MFTPAAEAGHAHYTRELMTALNNEPDSGFEFELVSAENLEDSCRNVPYKVHAILPRLKQREDFSSKAAWVMDRITYYPKRETAFLKWLENRPDVVAVHLQEWKPWLAVKLVRGIKNMGKKVYLTCHNVVPHRYPKLLPKSVVDGWIRKATLMSDGVFVLSEKLVEELKQFLGNDRPHPPIRVTRHGVWTVAGLDKNITVETRMSWKKLLMFGQMRSNKGLHTLLDAMNDLTDFSLTIAGQADDNAYWNQEITPRIEKLRDKGVKIDVMERFITDEEMGTLFKTHSAIMLPYAKTFKSQSGVAFMALAYDLPMIASEAGGLHDLLNEFKVGVMFTGYEASALAAATKQLFSSQSPSLLAAQIQSAKDHYSWAVCARQTINGYQMVQSNRMEAHDHAIKPSTAL